MPETGSDGRNSPAGGASPASGASSSVAGPRRAPVAASRREGKWARWASHPRAVHVLGGLSATEAVFSPLPPDVLLVPMIAAHPERTLALTAWTVLTSVAGGVAGYAVGALALDAVLPVLEQYGYLETYLRAEGWFREYGVWGVLFAGATPVPYKFSTLTAGALGLSPPSFVLASLAARAFRFAGVAALSGWGGKRFAQGGLRPADRVFLLILLFAFTLWWFWR